MTNKTIDEATAHKLAEAINAYWRRHGVNAQARAEYVIKDHPARDEMPAYSGDAWEVVSNLKGREIDREWEDA